jgi:hypothetical protein
LEIPSETLLRGHGVVNSGSGSQPLSAASGSFSVSK